MSIHINQYPSMLETNACFQDTGVLGEAACKNQGKKGGLKKADAASLYSPPTEVS